MTIVLRAAAAVALLGAATAVHAAEPGNGYTQIAAGDFATAERVITHEMRTFRGEPDLMLNLAAIYRHTGRTEQARALYRDVLTRPEADLVTPTETTTSYNLAHAALSHMSAGSLAER